MNDGQGGSIVLFRGQPAGLPDSSSDGHELSVTLLDTDETAGTAILELHNPDAKPDVIVGGLIEEHEEDVERSNRWRDRLHLPEKELPVDTYTQADQRLECALNEKLDVGDRVWKLSEITSDHVTLTPNAERDSESISSKLEALG